MLLELGEAIKAPGIFAETYLWIGSTANAKELQTANKANKCRTSGVQRNHAMKVGLSCNHYMIRENSNNCRITLFSSQDFQLHIFSILLGIAVQFGPRETILVYSQLSIPLTQWHRSSIFQPSTPEKALTLLTAEIIKWQKCARMGLNGFHINCIIGTHCNRKNQNPGSPFETTS